MEELDADTQRLIGEIDARRSMEEFGADTWRPRMTGVRPARREASKNICPDCGRNAVYEDSQQSPDKCIACHKRHGQAQRCYSCDLCVATRAYLAETDKQFRLIYYGRYPDSEVWQCGECNYCLEFEVMLPRGERDLLHEQARRTHQKEQCAWLKSGRIEII